MKDARWIFLIPIIAVAGFSASAFNSAEIFQIAGRPNSYFTPRINDDAQIKKEIQKALGLFQKDHPDIKVEVIGGNAIIRGKVEHQTDKENVLKRVRGIDGVKDVQDAIVVK